MQGGHTTEQPEEAQESTATGVSQYTQPAKRYIEDEQKLLSFLGDTMNLSKLTDQVNEAASALNALGRGEGSGSEVVANIRKSLSNIPVLKHGRLLAQMQLTRSVDSFQSYISELLALIYHTKPDMLKTDQATMTIAEILSYGSRDELVAVMVERRVNDLAYKGLRELSDDLKKRIKFDLFPDTTHMEMAFRIIAIRNLIVHNRGIIDRRFVSKLPEYQTHLGEPIALSIAHVNEYHKFLLNAAGDIDERARKKYNLPAFDAD